MEEYIITSKQYAKLIFAAANLDFDIMDDIVEELENNKITRCRDCRHYYDGRCYIDRDLGKTSPVALDDYCSCGVEVENG